MAVRSLCPAHSYCRLHMQVEGREVTLARWVVQPVASGDADALYAGLGAYLLVRGPHKMQKNAGERSCTQLRAMLVS